MAKPNQKLSVSWSEHKDSKEGDFTSHIIKTGPFRITVIDARAHYLPGIYYQLDYPEAMRQEVFNGAKPTARIQHVVNPGIAGIRLKIPFENGKPQYELLAATAIKGAVNSSLGMQTMSIAMHEDVEQSLALIAKHLAKAVKDPTAHRTLAELNEHLQNVHKNGIANMKLSDGTFDLNPMVFFKLHALKSQRRNK